MIRISKYQLFTLIMLFEIGSTTLFALGIDAKQDAWLAIIGAMLVGLVLLWLYTRLQKNFPEQNLVEIILALLGKWLGAPLVLLYALYFFYIATRNLRDFGDLINITLLTETPEMVVLAIFMIAVLYILLLGFEVLSRTSEVILPLVIVYVITTWFLVLVSGQLHFEQLAPILANGIRPILDAAFPIVTFPFGEMVLFLMYWCYADAKQDVTKMSFLAVLVSGVILVLTTVMVLAVLGSDFAANLTIPLLAVIKLINIGDILTNLDAIGMISIFVGGLFKMTLFFYGGVLAVTTLFKIKNECLVLIPMGILVVWFAMVFEPNYPFHLWLGLQFTPKYIHVPFELIMPTMLLIISLVRRSISKQD